MYRHGIVLFATLLAIFGCRDFGRSAETDPKLVQQAFDILKKCCARCHGPDGTKEGGLDYVLDVKKMVEKRKVIPGDPAKSKVLKKIIEEEMPPEDEKPRPSKEEVATLEKWIKAGASPFAAAATTRSFKSSKDTLTTIRDHLRKTDRQDRQFQRYFTLTHLYNNKIVSAADLRLYRAALAKLVNHLSWKSLIVVPEAVDAEQTIFVIDIRRLDWDRHHLWNEVLKLYPYGLKSDHDSNEEVQEMAREVYEQSGTDLPALRADWFIATASRPPLYHTILFEGLMRLPKTMTAHDLEAKLGVDVVDNFLRDKLTRAGFTSSGVSSENRLVERHEASYGAYWKSYDFKSNEGESNLFRFPLGPVFKSNPYPHQAFVQAGGEFVFNLPNGLQGYLLVDGKDRRIDEGPIEVVSDSLKTSGTAKVINGLSCLACHNRGMKSEFKDTVREGSALAGEARDKVRRLYPKPEAMTSLLKEDEDRFLRSLDKAMGKILKVGPDKARDIGDFPEPVGIIARLYLLKEIGPLEAAYELGLPDPAKLQVAIQANDRLKQLGLGPLVQGNTIKRETWESLDRFNSAFQEAANVLDLGTPKRVR